jgi:glycosyltransferase involved in cell wall biosynthesis
MFMPRDMAELAFWCSALLVLYAYLGYPLALQLVSLFRDRPIRRAGITPRVSFIITAYNEQARIREKIGNTLAQRYPAPLLEIIVASDCSTDRTDDIVRGYPHRIRLVRAPERRGKEAAQLVAIEACSGDILIFSDVATALAPDGVSTIVRNFADATVGCVSSVDRFIDADGRQSGEGAYVRYEMWLRTLETRVNSVVGLSGSFFAARREVCASWAADRQSDFSTLLSAVELGFRGVLDIESAGYYRNIVDGRNERQRKVRTVVRGISVLGGNLHMLNPMRHGLFAWQLASHKLCRWLVPFAMIAAVCSNATLAVHSHTYLAIFSLQLAFYAAAIGGGWMGPRILQIPSFFLQANVAVLTAWFRYARGERITRWNPSDRLAALPSIR